MSRRDIIDELHKPARKNFIRRKVIIKGLNDLFQADLVDMSAFASVNKGYKFLLTVIDCFSKYAWAIPIKDKSGNQVTLAMKSIFLKDNRIPKNLQTDKGKEFYNKDFQNLMKKYTINLYSTYSTLKASIIERFNRTLKNKMYKEFTMNGNYKWLNIIDELLKNYNNTKHSTIKMKPIDVNKSNENRILNTVYNNLKIRGRSKLKLNNYVRISKNKHLFEKGYTPNWTTEIFKIKKIQNTNPVTYILEDFQGNDIKGGFYELELLKVKHPDVYLIEKIVKTKGNKVFVKWLGFSSNFNSWINKSEIV
jgi:Integrase core domain